MKKIIKGKRYDTETAEKVGFDCGGGNGWRDFGYWEETLYRKRSGEFFLFGEGGPATKYRKQVEMNSWSGGWEIQPLTVEEAKQWAEERLDGDEYEEIFGEVEEAAEKKVVTFSLALDVVEIIKRKAASEGISLSECVERIVRGAK